MAMYAAGRAPLANLQSAQDLHQRLTGLRGKRRRFKEGWNLRQVSQGDEEVQMRRYDRSHHKSNHHYHHSHHTLSSSLHDNHKNQKQQHRKKNKANNKKKNYQLSDRHRYLAEALEGSSPPDSVAVGDVAAAAAATTAEQAGSDIDTIPATNVVPTSPDIVTQPYNTEQVLATQQMFENHHKAALLIFDGSRSAIECYIPDGPDLEGPSKRCWPAFLLARALFHHHKERFAPGSQPFQLLYTTGDYPHLNCLGTDGGCGFDGDGDDKAGGGGGATPPLAPILSFGSVPRDPTVLPTATAMPFPSMAECLVRDCRLLAQNALERGDASAQQHWEDLKPQILWRGDDYTTFADNFDLGLQHGVDLGIEPNTMTTEEVADRLIELWDTLTPSWRAVASSLRARIDADQAAAADAAGDGPGPQPWIDAKFTMGHSPAYKLYDTKFVPFLDAGSEVATAEYVGADEMASYRYHIDIVTGGATSWEDTVRKLALPGLLFHHESLMKDWFYDELKAWEHYVPVRMDLSDLSEKCKCEAKVQGL